MGKINTSDLHLLDSRPVIESLCKSCGKTYTFDINNLPYFIIPVLLSFFAMFQTVPWTCYCQTCKQEWKIQVLVLR